MNYVEQHEQRRIQQEAEDLRIGVAPYRCTECKYVNMLRIDHSVVFFCRACHCCVLEKVREYKAPPGMRNGVEEHRRRSNEEKDIEVEDGGVSSSSSLNDSGGFIPAI